MLNTLAVKNPTFDTKLSGSTGVIVLRHESRIVCANVGDSRAVLYSSHSDKTVPIKLSTDHLPTIPEEKKRILQAGGKIYPSRRIVCISQVGGRAIGPPRIWNKGGELPGLMMSRSFGDEAGHAVGIVCTPGTAC